MTHQQYTDDPGRMQNKQPGDDVANQRGARRAMDRMIKSDQKKKPKAKAHGFR